MAAIATSTCKNLDREMRIPTWAAYSQWRGDVEGLVPLNFPTTAVPRSPHTYPALNTDDHLLLLTNWSPGTTGLVLICLHLFLLLHLCRYRPSFDKWMMAAVSYLALCLQSISLQSIFQILPNESF